MAPIGRLPTLAPIIRHSLTLPFMEQSPSLKMRTSAPDEPLKGEGTQLLRVIPRPARSATLVEIGAADNWRDHSRKRDVPRSPGSPGPALPLRDRRSDTWRRSPKTLRRRISISEEA